MNQILKLAFEPKIRPLTIFIGDFERSIGLLSISCAGPTPAPALNWFRRDQDGKFVWPGFGENMRVLEWIVNRAKGGKVMGIESPIGWMPRYRDINWDGIEGFSKEDFTQAMSIDKSDWDKELLETDELFIKLYDRIPKEMMAIKSLMLSGMWRSPDHWEMEPDPT